MIGLNDHVQRAALERRAAKMCEALGLLTRDLMGGPKRARKSRGPSRSERIIDSGWEGYAREEGHYDGPDY